MVVGARWMRDERPAGVADFWVAPTAEKGVGGRGGGEMSLARYEGEETTSRSYYWCHSHHLGGDK